MGEKEILPLLTLTGVVAGVAVSGVLGLVVVSVGIGVVSETTVEVEAGVLVTGGVVGTVLVVSGLVGLVGAGVGLGVDVVGVGVLAVVVSVEVVGGAVDVTGGVRVAVVGDE